MHDKRIYEAVFSIKVVSARRLASVWQVLKKAAPLGTGRDDK
jgi:hypothetical protein